MDRTIDEGYGMAGRTSQLVPANAERALQLIFQEPTAKRNQTEEPVAQ
jgi:hypothetical protein